MMVLGNNEMGQNYGDCCWTILADVSYIWFSSDVSAEQNYKIFFYWVKIKQNYIFSVGRNIGKRIIFESKTNTIQH